MDRWLFNLGAVLGTVCLVLAGLTLVFGLKPLVFSSGSMGPAIPTGSLAMAIPAAASDIAPGEVVSVVASDGTRITHRVVSADPTTGLVLKGDANALADLQPYTGEAVDKVLFSIPGLGYVASWLASPWIFLLGGLLCAYLIYAAFFRPRPEPAARPRSGSKDGSAGAGKSGTRNRSWLGLGAIAVVVAVAVPLGAAAKVETTQAAWTANAVAGSSVAAASVSQPGQVHCQQAPGNIAKLWITWAKPAEKPSGYRIEAIETNSSGVGVNGGLADVVKLGADETLFETAIGPGSSGLLGDLLGALLGKTAYFTITVTAEYGTWSAAPVSFTKIKATTPLVLGLIGEYRLTCSPNPG